MKQKKVFNEFQSLFKKDGCEVIPKNQIGALLERNHQVANFYNGYSPFSQMTENTIKKGSIQGSKMLDSTPKQSNLDISHIHIPDSEAEEIGGKGRQVRNLRTVEEEKRPFNTNTYSETFITEAPSKPEIKKAPTKEDTVEDYSEDNIIEEEERPPVKQQTKPKVEPVKQATKVASKQSSVKK